MNDALTFGAKVLSLPGFLTAKNISEVEISIVAGKTTWRRMRDIPYDKEDVSFRDRFL